MRALLWVCLFLQAACQSSKPAKIKAAANKTLVDDNDADTYPPDSYDRHQIPSVAGPVNVNVEIEIAQFFGVEEQDGGTDLDIFVTLTWTDKALKWDVRQNGLQQRRIEKPSEKIWIPGIDIPNAMKRYNVTKEAAVVKGDQGIVEYKRRIIVQTATSMDYSMYPFDRHSVEIYVESFFYSADQVKFVADEGSKITKGAEGPKFTVNGKGLKVRVEEPSDPETGKSRFILTLPIARKTTGVISMVVIPMAIVTLTSFSQFWIALDRLETRSFISCAALLAVMVFGATINENIPPVAYMTYLHYYVVICMVLTFFTIVEQTLMHYLELNLPSFNLKAIQSAEEGMRKWLPGFFIVISLLFLIVGKVM